MSRRRGEFEHRTSIFEGAFRAWSHLGGLEPEGLESKTASELDPLTNPLENDCRLNGSSKDKGGSDDNDGDKGDGSDKAEGVSGAFGSGGSGFSRRREYPYEPLPRSGLAHPFVQAILSPWLGPDADHDAIQLGLTTLRTWWQHRRKGESGSAVAALGTDKMRGVVEGYTRHFFNLAHCLVTNDREQPPRTLNQKMRELEKIRNKRQKKRAREEEAGKLAALALNAGLAHGLGTGSLSASGGGGGGDPASQDVADANLTPLERLHAAQRRQLAESGGVHSSLPGTSVDVHGKCVPGKIDLPSVVNEVSRQSTQLAHCGGSILPNEVTSSNMSGVVSTEAPSYGDPTTTPVVFISQKGDLQIAMSVDGITCAHCVKIVETVLRGCNGNKSPIEGLLDAAADRVLNAVLIKINKSSNAKRIAYESARNLAMVGYTAKAKELKVSDLRPCGADGKMKMDLDILSSAFEVVASTEPAEVFDWSVPCTCPDNGVLREDCTRHSQMNKLIFEAFERRAQQITQYMSGCGKKFGLECTCGARCKCKNCTKQCNENQAQAQAHASSQQQHYQQLMQQHQDQLNAQALQMQQHQQQQQQQDFQSLQQQLQAGMNVQQMANMMGNAPHCVGLAGAGGMPMGALGMGSGRNSLTSVPFGGRVGHSMSVMPENTFGRTMSGLSSLSIDWENMEDFDVNVDHSAHINNGGVPSPSQALKVTDHIDGIPATHDEMNSPMSAFPNAGTVVGGRRSSLRRNIPMDPEAGQNMQVSFKI